MIEDDTIYALATPAGKSALAIIRISGPKAISGARDLGAHLHVHRQLSRAVLIHPITGEPLDDAMGVAFEAPRSSTGENVVELTLHGGQLVYSSVLEALSCLSGFRPAEPGEFSRRAFLNGKLDLSAAEGLQDLIDATSERQRQIALRQLTGGSSDRIEEWREALVASMAHLEAWIDFPDEELPADLLHSFADEVKALKVEIVFHVKQSALGERIRDGFEIAIVGEPNVGKSSLLNALAKREVAITTPIAGTTRDLLEVPLEIDGYAVTLVDTAGLRENSGDVIESEGIRRAVLRAEAADAVLIVVDARAPQVPSQLFTPSEQQHTLYIGNKSDLVTGDLGGPWLPVSAIADGGIDLLVEALSATMADLVGSNAESILFNKERHRVALTQTIEHLAQAEVDLEQGNSLELIAESLRLAARALGRITGVVDIEDILDRIFAEFCLGK